MSVSAPPDGPPGDTGAEAGVPGAEPGAEAAAEPGADPGAAAGAGAEPGGVPGGEPGGEPVGQAGGEPGGELGGGIDAIGGGSGSDSSPDYQSDLSGIMIGGEGGFLEGDESQLTVKIQDAEKKLIADVMKESDESEEELAAAERKVEIKTLEKLIAEATQLQDANNPTVLKYPVKESMKISVTKAEDTTFVKSMIVAERGYINRLRPESTGERPNVSQYSIRPALENKFKALSVKEMIHSVLNDELGGKEYSEEEAKTWSQVIANTIRSRVKEMGFPRYKYVVQCVIGEEHGAGVKIGSRCLWDADTDNYASDTFLNETIFCMTAVYAVYFY